MAKPAKQIFAEADAILKDAFYVVDVTDFGDNFPLAAKCGKPELTDGGLGSADLNQGNTAKGKKSPEYFDAQSERKKMRKRDRAERVEFYREQILEQRANGVQEGQETLEYDERVDFSHGHARTDSFTNSYGMDSDPHGYGEP